MRKGLLLLSCVVFLSSCGKKPDVHEVVNGVIEKRSELISVLGEAKDLESAKVVAGKIDKIGDEMVLLGEQALEVKELTEEEKQEIHQRMLKAMSGMDEDVKEALRGVAGDAEAMKVIAEALKQFAEKVGKAEEGFKLLTVSPEKKS